MPQRTGLAIAGGLIVVVLVAIWWLPLDQWLTQAADWNKAHPVAGAVLFVALSVVGSVFFLPGSLVAMSAGYIYGLTAGSSIALIAITLGAFAAFLSGRLLVRGWVFAQIEKRPRLKALDRAVYDQSFLIVALTRLSLIIPFNILNYVYGVTGVRKTPYFVATAIGMIPATVLWTYFGTLAKNFADIRSGNLDSDVPGHYVLLVGLVMIALAVVVVHRTASRALKEKLGE